MSVFKFNFSSDEPKDTFADEQPAVMPVQWLPSEEVSPSSQQRDVDDMQRANMFTCGDLEIGHVIVSEALKNHTTSDDNVSLAEGRHSDLVTGIYEGGLKIWECTSDLIEYLLSDVDKERWEGASVLDLGCGAGLLGIAALMHGAHVVFQDYNKEVLESVTIPNVLLNQEDEETSQIHKCKFFSGDWDSFDRVLESSLQFDFILTSETIYNCDNYGKLINLFERRLKDGGTVFVAAKTYYFGVGGGTRQFEAAIEKSSLKSEVCWKCCDGIQREILKITHK